MATTLQWQLLWPLFCWLMLCLELCRCGHHCFILVFVADGKPLWKVVWPHVEQVADVITNVADGMVTWGGLFHFILSSEVSNRTSSNYEADDICPCFYLGMDLFTFMHIASFMVLMRFFTQCKLQHNRYCPKKANR